MGHSALQRRKPKPLLRMPLLPPLRLLNEQLMKRLGSERADHMQSKQSLAAATEAAERERLLHVQTKSDAGDLSQENEVLQIRLDRLAGQLFELATRNDVLLQDLAESESERRKLRSLQG